VAHLILTNQLKELVGNATKHLKGFVEKPFSQRHLIVWFSKQLILCQVPLCSLLCSTEEGLFNLLGNSVRILQRNRREGERETYFK
jgi:hypothetical protein